MRINIGFMCCKRGLATDKGELPRQSQFSENDRPGEVRENRG